MTIINNANTQNVSFDIAAAKKANAETTYHFSRPVASHFTQAVMAASPNPNTIKS